MGETSGGVTAACYTRLESPFHAQHFIRWLYASILNRIEVIKLRSWRYSKNSEKNQIWISYKCTKGSRPSLDWFSRIFAVKQWNYLAKTRQFSIFDILRFGAILYFVKVTPGKSGQKVTFSAPNLTPLKNSNPPCFIPNQLPSPCKLLLR